MKDAENWREISVLIFGSSLFAQARLSKFNISENDAFRDVENKLEFL